jgi:Cys-tRNA(Pro) deacylase
MPELPDTPALRFLRDRQIDFIAHRFPYVDKGGTAHSSQVLGVPEYEVIKTLIMQDDAGHPLVILMHGDQNVDTKVLARQLGRRSIKPCDPERAQQLTGYQVGGTSPFGLANPLSICVEETILSLSRLLINGGQRGFLVEISPDDLKKTLHPLPVSCGKSK